MRVWITLALLAPGLCAAAGPASFALSGGFGMAPKRELSQEPLDPLGLEYEDGVVYHVTGTGHFDSGLLLRAGYARTRWDEFTALDTLLIEEGVSQRELRLGAFYAPHAGTGSSYRIGGGFAQFGDALLGDAKGAFAEAALTLRGTRVSWDLSLARQELDEDIDFELDGTDLRLAAIVHLATVDVTLAARQLWLPAGDELVDYRIGVGRTWGATD